MIDKIKWQATEPTVTGIVRLVIVHNYVEEIITDDSDICHDCGYVYT